jgi:hypothetical protein
MTINKLDDFAENGDKNLTGIDVQQGFVQADKPARQWFNYIFNSITKKVNELVTAINNLVIGTDKIEDGAITIPKLAPDFEITGDNIAKDADLNTPRLTNTYALTSLDAPNLTLGSDGTLKRTNNPLNAASRKVGTAQGNLVERDANGYPSNNNAIGVGQTWQDMSASRDWNVTYTNTTGRPIVVFTKGINSSDSHLLVDDVAFDWAMNSAELGAGIIIVPTGSTYKALSVIAVWMELR